MKKIHFYYFLAAVLIVCTAGCGGSKKSGAGFLNIKNDVFWNTKDGQPIYSQGGGIFKFADPATGVEKYYWYGIHYKQSELYREDPSVTHGRNTFESITCYSSEDLVNWTFEADVLTKEELAKYARRPTWVGRMGVAYLEEAGRYALFVQHGNKVLVAISETPNGKFTWHQELDMTEITGYPNTGDQTVFIDEDTGKSYLIYSKPQGRNRIFISEIGIKDGMIGILDHTEIFAGAGREGNCMFKYRGKYYMCASELYGWDASNAYYLTADDIRGPYEPLNNMKIIPGAAEDYAHITQTGFFYTIKGTQDTTVIFCGDRWASFAGNGLGYNQWCPLSFDGDAPYFNSLSSWDVNPKTGKWHVAADNNYVKNGSFEADRNRIPSKSKPRQEQLLSWVSTVIEGNKIAVGDSLSPVLNYFNTQEDRKTVIGEKSLNISDNVDFKRTVMQVIASSPYVPLKDGRYTLSAKVRVAGEFTGLEMCAESDGRTYTSNIENSFISWTTIEIPDILVKGGKVEIGFRADGKAGSRCIVDDVSLIKK